MIKDNGIELSYIVFWASMKDWWHWWLKWWTLAGVVVLIIVIFSEPPRLWFWLAILAALIAYGFERAMSDDA